MCGICGIIHFDNTPVNESSVREMMRIMKRRGPDDDGVFIDNNVGLGFVRLSIIDLSQAGHQPMISSDGRYVLVFNGEIYNYIELGEILRSKGYTFKSASDTEVLLNAYIEWGESCLEYLNGMFAFALYDRISKDLFFARDRFGIKPFYYSVENNSFFFASDIPSVLKVLNNKPVANDSIIYDFLVYNRTNHNNQTFFQNINKLQHGHLLKISDNKISIKRWYDLGEKVNNKISKQYTIDDFGDELSRSVELQLRSDVPLGTCLSGGLDSSSITALVQGKSLNKDLHTFSAVYGEGIQGDESNFINLFRNCGLNMHYTTPSAGSLLDDMDRFQEALCEPVPNTSEYAEYKVMELAKKNCTVILNGQGADEIMAGYHYFFGYFFKDLLKQFKLGKLTSELFHYLNLHRSLLGIRSFGYSLRPHWFRDKNSRLLSKDFVKRFSKSTNPIVDAFYTSSSLQDFLISHFEYKFEHHLLWADKSGMYFSLETRFPFLDHNLVENTLASGITIKKGWTKHLLRESMKGILPEKICKRVDKVGYQTPEKLWFKEPSFKEYFLKIMNSELFLSRSYFNNAKCRKAISSYCDSGKFNSEFWKWLSLELWMRKFID